MKTLNRKRTLRLASGLPSYRRGICTDCERETIVYVSPNRTLPERYAVRLCAACRCSRDVARLQAYEMLADPA
jgi:hypothetical protein